MPVDWAKGVGYSIVASVIGGASKLAIRKSWLMVDRRNRNRSSRSVSPDPNLDSLSSPNLNHDDSIRQSGSYQSPKRIKSTEEEQVENTNQSALSFHPPAIGALELSETVSRDAAEEAAIIETNLCEIEDSKTQKMALALRFSGMIGMTFLNPLFCVLAMNYASPSILAPFSGLTLVWIILFSETLIGEKPMMKQIVAAFLIVLGEVIVAVFGDHTNDDGVSLDEVVESYKNFSFQLYFVGMFIWMTFLVYVIIKRPSTTLRRFAWGVAGGSITGFQNFLKDSLTISKAVSQSGEPYPWYFYIMMILAMGSSFGGLLFLTACMKRYDATFSSAMFVGSFVISASIMAAVHYQTFQNLKSLSNLIMYPAGLIVLMVGVKMLVDATSEQDIEFDTGDENEGEVFEDPHESCHVGMKTRLSSDSSIHTTSSSEMRKRLVRENEALEIN